MDNATNSRICIIPGLILIGRLVLQSAGNNI
jgi:hypothetical protein